MVVLAINKIDVDFPFTPYGPQIQYMSRVIDALRRGQNALLESPTGTGKTLCLLCAALAWRSTYLAALQARVHGALTPALAAAAGLDAAAIPAGDALGALLQPGAAGDAATTLRAPRIVYASRTHSQLAQAVHELRRTAYRPGVAMLASRDQLCVHDAGREMSGARLNARCRRLTAPAARRCRFHLPVASPRATENRCDALVAQLHAKPPMDIEDLRAFGAREGACPFYLARAAAQAESCEIVFVPYNYLIDRGTRASLDVDWANDIVIIDEAHNLESVCADAMSFDLTPAARAGCDAELAKCLAKGLNPMGIAIPALEELAKTKEGLDAVLGTENRDMLEFRIMRSVLMNIEEFVDKVEFDSYGTGDIQYAVFPPEDFRRLLQEVNGPSEETFELFLDLLDRAMGITGDAENANEEGDPAVAKSSARSSSPLQTLKSALRILFETSAKGSKHSFRMVVHEDPARQKGRTLSYWCFDSSIAMKDVASLGLRSLLLTSGTLSPLSTFASELGLPFPVRLENPHVITKSQVLAGVVQEGPRFSNERPTKLSSAYRSRGEDTQLALGRSIIEIAKVVPDGLLVFFPSYSTMHSNIEMWKKKGPGPTREKPSVWEHLLRRKLLVVEERHSHELSAAMLAHRTNVDSKNGSILFAVCRGKVSEGIDFSDEYGRAVVITGLPYPSAGDPRVKLKRETADFRFREWKERGGTWGPSSPNSQSVKVLSGSEWYTVQAIRAVNQAIGRAIRHRNDYGVVLLCDERFAAGRVQEQVSKWLRPHINVFGRFDGVGRSVASFFEQAQKAPFADPSNSKRSMIASLQVSRPEYGPRDGSRSAVLLAEEAITKIVPKQFSNDELLAKVEELTEQAAAMRDASQERRAEQPNSVLPWDSSMPVGGSSSMSLQTRSEKQSAPSGPSYSARFLAKRARMSQGGYENSCSAKKSKRKSCENEEMQGQAAKKKNGGSISWPERAKAVFKTKQDLRKFITVFRRLMAAEKKLKEGPGPLQNGANNLAEAMRDGVDATKEFVRFTRSKAGKSGPSSIVAREDFLSKIRQAVPEQFREVYDALLQNPQSE